MSGASAATESPVQQSKKRVVPGYVRAILGLYNTCLLASWSYMLFLTVDLINRKSFSRYPDEDLFTRLYSTSFSDIWLEVGDLMKYSQLAALIEILFIVIGWVPSQVATAALQCSVRLLVMYGAMSTPWCETNDFTGTTLVVAYCLSEIIRYAFYAGNAVSPSGTAPYPIVWLRYTAFIILYPTGLICEMYLLATTFPYLDDENFWSISLPNTMNIVFYYPAVLWGLMFAFPPGFWALYLHMWAQRAKVIGGKGSNGVKNVNVAGTTQKVKSE